MFTGRLDDFGHEVYTDDLVEGSNVLRGVTEDLSVGHIEFAEGQFVLVSKDPSRAPEPLSKFNNLMIYAHGRAR